MENAFIKALRRQKMQQMIHQPQPLPPDLLGPLTRAEDNLYNKSMIYKALKDAVTAPGRAYRGEIGQPWADEDGNIHSGMPELVEHAMNTAGMAQLGGIPGGARGPGSVGMSSTPKGWIDGWQTRVDQPYIEGPPAPKRPRDTWGGYSTPEEYQAAQAARESDNAVRNALARYQYGRIQREPLPSQIQTEGQYGNQFQGIAQDVPPYLNDRPVNHLGETIPPTQYELAHMEAQRVAALPVEQGGLGLPPDNTYIDRANAIGSEFGWAHGSPNPDITEMRSSQIGAEGPGSYATNYMPETNTYAQLENGATVYPLAVNKAKTLNAGNANPYELLGVEDDPALIAKLFDNGMDSIVKTQEATPQWLIDAGGLQMPSRKHYVSTKPENFRSRFAAFNPAKRDSADLLATLAPYAIAAPLLSGNLYDYLGQE